MTRMATQSERFDHDRDLRKHEARPGDVAPLDQRCTVAQLVGYCEGLCGYGVLSEAMELQLRKLVAQTLVAFNMPAKADRVRP